MNKIVIYCKSFHRDVHRVKRLLDSIQQFNSDDIPFYVSVPSNDVELFENVLGQDGYHLIEDESILNIVSNKERAWNEGWKEQQMVKSQFWKTNVCENYVCVDSDQFFIKPFYKKDFMFDDNTPYTVCHQHKHFFEFLQKHLFEDFDPYESFKKDRLFVMDLFDRDGPLYDFGPSPTIWSRKVWESLEEQYIKPNNLTFIDLININPSEFTWYGEWLLYSQVIRLMPLDPLFKIYHYPIMWEYDKKYEYDFDKISKLYLGVGVQSIYDFDDGSHQLERTSRKLIESKE